MSLADTSDPIPLADADPLDVLHDEDEDDRVAEVKAKVAEAAKSQLWAAKGGYLNDCESLDSIPAAFRGEEDGQDEDDGGDALSLLVGSGFAGSTLGDGGDEDGSGGKCGGGGICDDMLRQLSLDPDFSPDEAEEKARL